jgi:hypothetical protein
MLVRIPAVLGIARLARCGPGDGPGRWGIWCRGGRDGGEGELSYRAATRR